MTITIPDIEELRQIVVGDEGDEYEALDVEATPVSRAKGEIKFGITFVMEVTTVVVVVRRVCDQRTFRLVIPVHLHPGDQLTVTQEMCDYSTD